MAKFTNSKLVTYTRLSPNYSIRTRNIDKITLHIIAGNISLQTLGNIFAPRSRNASSNYGVDGMGRVGMYVEEKHRAWTSSNAANDQRAVTIEIANSATGGQWPISAAAMEGTIMLCVDICRRNNMSKLNYTGNKNGTLTRHNMFANTLCPGPYVQSKLAYIELEVNKRIASGAGLVSPIKPYMEFGDRGNNVKELQKDIMKLGGYEIEIDGIFGKDTLDKVKIIQEKAGLTVDGIVGKATLAEIKKGITEPKGYFQRGDTGKGVEKLQQDLVDLGGYRVEVNGKFDSNTRDKVTIFQRRNNLKDDGIAGKETLAMLEKLLKGTAKLTKVVVDGKQEGVYSEDQNVIDAVKRNIDKKNITIDKK